MCTSREKRTCSKQDEVSRKGSFEEQHERWGCHLNSWIQWDQVWWTLEFHVSTCSTKVLLHRQWSHFCLSKNTIAQKNGLGNQDNLIIILKLKLGKQTCDNNVGESVSMDKANIPWTRALPSSAIRRQRVDQRPFLRILNNRNKY